MTGGQKWTCALNPTLEAGYCYTVGLRGVHVLDAADFSFFFFEQKKYKEGKKQHQSFALECITPVFFFQGGKTWEYTLEWKKEKKKT